MTDAKNLSIFIANKARNFPWNALESVSRHTGHMRFPGGLFPGEPPVLFH